MPVIAEWISFLLLRQNVRLSKNNCKYPSMVSPVGWEAQLRRMRNCREFLNAGVSILLFFSTSKGEGRKK